MSKARPGLGPWGPIAPPSEADMAVTQGDRIRKAIDMHGTWLDNLEMGQRLLKERQEMLTKRLDALSARVDALQPKQGLGDDELEDGDMTMISVPDRLWLKQNRIDSQVNEIRSLEKQVSTLLKRVASSQQDLVACPACDGECYDSSRDGLWDDEPPYQVACDLCKGVGQVEEHVAAYVQKRAIVEARLWDRYCEATRVATAQKRPDPLKRFPPEPMPTAAPQPEKWQTHEEES